MPQPNKCPAPLVGGNGANLDLAGGSISPTTNAGSTQAQAQTAHRLTEIRGER
jgi:hypothetical protein